MSESASISSGIAERYALAIFEIAKENQTVKELESELDGLAAALDESAELRDLINSPVYSREDQGKAVDAVAQALNLNPLLRNSLGLMSSKRRLFVLPQLIEQLRAMIAADKGEVTADVVAAKALTQAQQTKLAAALKASVGKDVKINATVDESLIGGLIVKVGSKMIDSSIRSKLAALQNTMKEVG